MDIFDCQRRDDLLDHAAEQPGVSNDLRINRPILSALYTRAGKEKEEVGDAWQGRNRSHSVR